ncbi:MAG: dUTP diphosphatase [Desulfocapsaceae bacterium]|nr:dUTP diphosphatase [Desulfocapsaceae bacterium]
MEERFVYVRWLEPEQSADLALPVYQSDSAAGMDVAAAVYVPLTLEPGQISLIPTGFAIAIPEGCELQIRPRSGLAIKHGITLINSPGTIDADYRGEVKIGLINLGGKPYTINRGDRIAQMILAPVMRARLVVVRELDATGRGSGGFGHTGV